MPETETLTLPVAAADHRGRPSPDGGDPGPRVARGAVTPPRVRSRPTGESLLVPTVGTGYATRRHHRPDRERRRAARAAAGPGPPRPGPRRRGHAGARRAPPACGSRPSPSRDAGRVRPGPRAGARVPRRSCAASPSSSGRRASPTRSQGVDDPGALADTAGWSPDLSVERKVELLETLDAEARLEKALAVGARRPRRARSVGPDPQPGQRRHGQDPARVPAAPAARGDPQGAGRGRRRGRRSRITAPARRRATFPRRRAKRSTREVDRLERTSEQSPEHGWIRTWLDTVLEIPWGDALRRSTRRRRRARRSSTPTTPASTT